MAGGTTRRGMPDVCGKFPAFYTPWIEGLTTVSPSVKQHYGCYTKNNAAEAQAAQGQAAQLQGSIPCSCRGFVTACNDRVGCTGTIHGNTRCGPCVVSKTPIPYLLLQKNASNMLTYLFYTTEQGMLWTEFVSASVERPLVVRSRPLSHRTRWVFLSDGAMVGTPGARGKRGRERVMIVDGCHEATDSWDKGQMGNGDWLTTNKPRLAGIGHNWQLAALWLSLGAMV